VPTLNRRINCISFLEDDRRVLAVHPTKWFYDLGANIPSTPMLINDRVVAASNHGVIHSLAQSTGQLHWRFFINTKLTAPLASLEKEIYAADEESNVFSIDVSSGRKRWAYIAGYPILNRPAPFIDDVYVSAEGAGLIALRNRDEGSELEMRAGSERWRNVAVRRFAAASQKNLYGFDRSNNLMILSRDVGNLVGRLALPGFSVLSENQIDDRVYASTDSGLIVCLSERDNVAPFRHPQKVDQQVAPLKDQSEGDDKRKSDKKGSGFFDDVIAKPKKAMKNEEKGDNKAGDGEQEKEATKGNEPKKKKKSFFDDD
jgi:hypothetical protein